MTYNNLISYLLWQTKVGISLSKYEEYVKDWMLVPNIHIRKDGTVWVIKSCQTWIVLNDGKALLLNMPSLVGEDARDIYTEDAVQRHVDALIYTYSLTQDGKWIKR